jgi:hypothetical protein
MAAQQAAQEIKRLGVRILENAADRKTAKQEIIAMVTKVLHQAHLRVEVVWADTSMWRRATVRTRDNYDDIHITVN